jgi:hypothetical protein
MTVLLDLRAVVDRAHLFAPPRAIDAYRPNLIGLLKRVRRRGKSA